MTSQERAEKWTAAAGKGTRDGHTIVESRKLCRACVCSAMQSAIEEAVAEERERCAKIVEDRARLWTPNDKEGCEHEVLMSAAAAIRGGSNG